jgi:uncharacterized protein (DUF2225 family)
MGHQFKIEKGSKSFAFVEEGHDEIKEYIRQGDTVTFEDTPDFKIIIENEKGISSYTLSKLIYDRLLDEMNRNISISHGNIVIFKK